MTEFLLELYSEEIPARMQEKAAIELANKIGTTANTKYYYTPQRIVIHADLPDNQPDQLIDKRGPKLSAPEQAVQGFLKSVGLSKAEDAQIIEEKGQQYYYYKNTVKGEPTKDWLAKTLTQILNDFTWPKSMRWGSYDERWVRPLHSIMCIFDEQVVPFKFGHIKSGVTTVGHRFLDKEEINPLPNVLIDMVNTFPINLLVNIPASLIAGTFIEAIEKDSVFARYAKHLLNRKVIIDQEARKHLILEQARKLAGSYKLDEDPRLLAEVANLVEYPVVMLGTFSEEFLSVPQECLISTMKTNQKYFPLFDADGKLANKFIIVSNMIAEDGGKRIIAGNERVIKARLSDAKFFWDQDRKDKLETLIPKLEKVVFHAKIGTVYDKVKHVAELSKFIANIIGADATKAHRAGFLCKADLVSGMVGEFAELQGIMGAYYAEKDEGKEVAQAIKEHYLPAGQDDAIPTAPISICVALADKLYSLVQLWEAGEKPTGSRDPFGLRRSALGIIRIILENNLKLSLRSLIIEASKTGETGTEEIFAFFVERMKFLLKSHNIRHDYIAAALDGKTDDLVTIRNKAIALSALLSTETGANLLAAYRRAANILSIEEKKDKTTYPPAPEFELLEAGEEKTLHTAITDSEAAIAKALNSEDFTGAMAELAKLQPYVNAFFDKVIVNSDKSDVRINRLKLLAKIRDYIEKIADFRQLEN